MEDRTQNRVESTTSMPELLGGQCPGPHVDNMKASLLHRQVGFFHSLLAGPCKEASVAALLASRDKRSTLGANLALVREVTSLDPWTAGRNELRAALEAAELSPVPPMDKWRIPALEKLLAARLAANYRADVTEVDRLQDLIIQL